MIATLRPLTYDDLWTCRTMASATRSSGGSSIVTPVAAPWTITSGSRARSTGWILQRFRAQIERGWEGVHSPRSTSVSGSHDIVEPDLVFMGCKVAFPGNTGAKHH